MAKYELYVCGFKFGCNTLANFEANSDKEACIIGNEKISKYEDNTGDSIYREYLYKNVNGKEIEVNF